MNVTQVYVFLMFYLVVLLCVPYSPKVNLQTKVFIKSRSKSHHIHIPVKRKAEGERKSMAFPLKIFCLPHSV